MIVVSDTSPVLNLARIGLTVSKSDRPPAIDLAAQPWLMIATANDQKRVQELRKDLDRAEAEAIVLAIERRA